MTPEINELMVKCLEAKQAFKEQEKKMWGERNQYNGRYAPKERRLFKAWDKAQQAMLKEINKSFCHGIRRQCL
jgi:predicted glycosyl hydrolase (DUF1957 family)